MNKLVFSTVIMLSSFILQAQTSDLTIRISGLKKQEGTIQLGLYDKSNNFPKENLELMAISLVADSSTVVHTIADLPHGEYAIAYYHDVNDDNKCNRNWIGIPTESYGFSNNIVVKFSAPSFEKTKFSLDENKEILMSLNR